MIYRLQNHFFVLMDYCPTRPISQFYLPLLFFGFDSFFQPYLSLPAPASLFAYAPFDLRVCLLVVAFLFLADAFPELSHKVFHETPWLSDNRILAKPITLLSSCVYGTTLTENSGISSVGVSDLPFSFFLSLFKCL